MNIKSILAVILLTSFTSFAFANTYTTVCGYMPEGQFSEPIEQTLESDSGYPVCPSSFVETSSVSIPIVVGGQVVGYHRETAQTIYVLVYELPGGY